ncbi:PREDICTED: putative fatty acyl-CoA reductase CG8306, partial [Polistes dominula]|uniref:Fatty acyl-CoA reductase n=1 Tax=Polistes dominula TaxID=743375 RepID=A0ABM1J2F0_POLDO
MHSKLGPAKAKEWGAKKQKDPQIRFKEYFNDVIFDRLKREQKDVEKKIILIEGDTSLLNLGLSEKDRDRIKDTDLIFHSAASVRFMENLRFIVNTNIRGTRDLLLLAQEVTRLKAFVYVSTAYSHCVYNNIEEKFYKLFMKKEDIIRLTETLTQDYSNRIPTCIVQSFLVVPTKKEPIVGWINNIYGLTGVTYGSSSGILRTLYCNSNLICDIIPADYVINNIIAAAWDVAQKRSISQSVNLCSKDNKYLPDYDEIPVYNSVSSVQRPITYDTIMHNVAFEGLQVPSKKVLWYASLWYIKNYYFYIFMTIFLHWIPAIIVDSFLYLSGRKPILLNVYRKIEKFKHVMSFFSMNEWEFT